MSLIDDIRYAQHHPEHNHWISDLGNIGGTLAPLMEKARMTHLTGFAKQVAHLEKNLKIMEALIETYATAPNYADGNAPEDLNTRNAWLLCRLKSIIAGSLSTDEQG